jgi:hypothetical protein
MQLSIDLKTKDIISLISQMSLHEIEKVKNILVERELYFKKEDYSDDFLADLKERLKKSSVYTSTYFGKYCTYF